MKFASAARNGSARRRNFFSEAGRSDPRRIEKFARCEGRTRVSVRGNIATRRARGGLTSGDGRGYTREGGTRRTRSWLQDSGISAPIADSGLTKWI